MTKTFTQNDILRYVYNETTNEEDLLIEECLLFDSKMLQFYLDMTDTKLGLEKVAMQPSARSIDNILAFSKNYQTKKPLTTP